MTVDGKRPAANTGSSIAAARTLSDVVDDGGESMSGEQPVSLMLNINHPNRSGIRIVRCLQMATCRGNGSAV
jgi:hypothetical protein